MEPEASSTPSAATVDSQSVKRWLAGTAEVWIYLVGTRAFLAHLTRSG